MAKILGILGDIGSGKSFIARQFGFPVFDADKEVNLIYKKNNSCFKKLKNKLPEYIKTYPVDKKQLSEAILASTSNIKKIANIIHPLVRKKMNIFLKKNIKKKIVVLDVPLLIENNLNKKNYILIFVEAKKKEVNIRLKKRLNYNKKIIEKLRKIQKPLRYKKKISKHTIKNNFKLSTIKKRVNIIKKKILNERSSS